jgi:hypothetical protein
MQGSQRSVRYVSQSFTSSVVFTLLALAGWLTFGSGLALAKPAAKAATKSTPAASDGTSSSDTPAAVPAPDDAPSSGPADSSSGASTAAGSASTENATSTPAPTSTENGEPSDKNGQVEATADESRPFAEPPAPPPPGVEPIPATVAPAAQAPAAYVEHLGPESFPGRLRGLYGGSLWLEPSFNGLQWPYMAHTGIGVSGNFWVDSGYETIKRDPKLLFESSTMYLMQGRGVLRVTPTYVRGNFFVQGQAEVVGNLCQATNDGATENPAVNTVCTSAGTYSTDDLWIRVGQWNIWDLKVGRFEGWEVYHVGMGMDQYTLERMGAGMFGQPYAGGTVTSSPNGIQLEAPSLYGVNYLHDRPTDGLAVGYIALHAYATQWLRFEDLVKLGSNNYRNDTNSPLVQADTPPPATTLTALGNEPGRYFGDRLTAILDVGWFKFKFGAEYQKRTPIMQDPTTSPSDPTPKDPVANTVQEGVGASAQFVIDPTVEFGLNAAIGKQQNTNAEGNGFSVVYQANYTTKSVGGFANLRLADLWLLGLGLNMTEQTDQYLATGSNVGNYTSHLQTFAALQYLLGGQLFIKAVFGYAKAYFQPSDPTVPTWTNDMYSARVRLMYMY